VARVRLASGPVLLLAEFQTRWRADVPARMAEYALRLHWRDGQAVEPVVVVLCRGGRPVDCWRLVGAGGRSVAECRFRVVCLWQVPAQEVIAAGLSGLYPFLPLLDWGPTPAATVLARSRELVVGQPGPRQRIADARVALAVLSRLVYPRTVVRSALDKEEPMLDLRESPLYREILREGRVEGREEGRVEGREEGEVRALRTGVLRVLTRRLGPISGAVAAQVAQVVDTGVLSALLEQAAVVADVPAFLQALAAAPLPPAPPTLAPARSHSGRPRRRRSSTPPTRRKAVRE
jgi:hypothetical protein